MTETAAEWAKGLGDFMQEHDVTVDRVEIRSKWVNDGHPDGYLRQPKQIIVTFKPCEPLELKQPLVDQGNPR